MKIFIIGPAHPLRGGLASYNERLAREFINQGHEVKIYTFSLQYPSFLFPGTTQYSSEPAPKDLEIKVSINSVNPVNWVLTGNEIKKLKPDIVVFRYWLPFMGPCLGTIARIVKQNRYTKVVCIADNIIPHEKRIGDTAFTKYFIKPVDAFITMSEKVLSDLKNFSDKPARFVVHPLYDNFGEAVSKNTARNYLQISEKDNIVLFFGFIRKYKGLDLLLEAAAILKTEHPDLCKRLKFLVAGEFYEDRKYYDELIKKYELDNLLIMRTNFIADSEVKFYLCAADVLVQPYKNATQSGVTPLAYHFEIPMIVTNVGGLAALVPHNVAGLVAESDARSIAETVISFFQTGRDHFIPGLKEEKKKYSWSKMTEAIIDSAASAN